MVLEEVMKLVSPEYSACSESLPVGNAVVTHWALADTRATAPHVPIVAPPLSKFTVPVAPGERVALRVTDPPNVEDEGLGLKLVAEVA
jgi:hypothetical protein